MDKSTLQQYRDLDREIRHLQKDIVDIRNRYRSILQPDPAPGKPNQPGDPTGKIAAMCADLEADLMIKIVNLVTLRTEIEGAISGLRPRDRMLVRLRYIYGLSWRRVALEMNYSEDHTKRLHGGILQRLK